MNKQVSILLLSTLFGAQALNAFPPLFSKKAASAPAAELPAAPWAERHPAIAGPIVGGAEAAALAGGAYGLVKVWQNRQAIIDWAKEHPFQAAGYTAGAVATAALTAYAWHNWLPVAAVNTFVKVGTVAAYDGIWAGLKWGWSKTPWNGEEVKAGAMNHVGRKGVEGAVAAAEKAAAAAGLVAANAVAANAKGPELPKPEAAKAAKAAAAANANAPEAAEEPKANNLTPEEATKLAHYRREGRSTLGKSAQANMDALIAKEAGK